MPDQITVTKRTQLGSRQCRRLRREGKIPATLYGHGEASVSLSVPALEVSAALRHGAKLITLAGDAADSVLIREVQCDAMGLEILHVDLTRVSADESVDIQVAIELRGVAPGVSEGGVVEHSTHDLSINCPVTAIPEKLEVRISQLHLGESILAKEVVLPEGATLNGSEDRVVVSCVEPVAEADGDEAGAPLPGEPEVIGRRADEEASEG